MDSVPGVDEELYNFLGSQLLPFLLDEIAPTDNINSNAARSSHLTEKELDNLFSSAFEEYDGADRQIREYNEASSSKTVSNLITPTLAKSNASYPSSSKSSVSKLESTASNFLHVIKAKSKGSRESSISNVVKPPALKASNPSHPLPKAIRKFSQVVSNEDITRTMHSAIPQKTQRDNKYCYNLWNDWVSHRENSNGETIPLLHNITVKELQHWLCAFVLEVRKKDGNAFIPNTLHHICCGIMRYLRTNGLPHIDIFKDSGFSQFRMVLDSEMKRLQSAGIGAIH